MSSSDLPDRPRRSWTSTEFRNVFYNQYVVVLGDSIQRAIYKDFVKLHQTEDMLTPQNLKAKGEESFMGDKLLRRSPKMTNGKDYEEIRCYQHDANIFKFFFLTKIYSDYVESVVFDDLHRSPPDILIVNSCVWDITRYGPEAISEYKLSLERFFTRICHDHVVPASTEIIWLTTLPLGAEIKGGFIVNTVKFMDVTQLRLDILEANRWVAENVAPFYDVNVLDLHYMLRTYQEWRELDGIHWNGYAHRFMTSAICEFVEYLNIRALRERQESQRKDKFSEGPSFAQPVLPLASSLHNNNAEFQMPSFDAHNGPIRMRRVINREPEPLSNYRDAAPYRRPSSSFSHHAHVEKNVMMFNSAAQHLSFEASRQYGGLSSSHIQRNPEIPSFANNFSGFEDRKFSRPFWAQNDFAHLPR